MEHEEFKEEVHSLIEPKAELIGLTTVIKHKEGKNAHIEIQFAFKPLPLPFGTLKWSKLTYSDQAKTVNEARKKLFIQFKNWWTENVEENNFNRPKSKITA